MILGYDVYHCSERKGYSVGALVATTSDNLAKYFSVVSFHKDKSELSSNMCSDTKSKLNIPGIFDCNVTCVLRFKKLNYYTMYLFQNA
jgi:hypothetical protein